MKLSQGFTRPGPTVVRLSAMLASFGLLSISMRTPVTPGDNRVRLAKLRPDSGSESSSARDTVVPSVFLVVSTNGAAPVAVTCLVNRGGLQGELDGGLLPDGEHEPRTHQRGKALEFGAYLVALGARAATRVVECLGHPAGTRKLNRRLK